MAADAPGHAAYVAGLKLLAARELSAAQVRTRLRRRFSPDDIDAAITRLRADGALDERRTARAIARTTALHRGQGRRRARQRLEAAGIDRATAAAAVDEVFADVDDRAQIAAALERRLRGRTELEDRAEQARLFRYLVGQGFDSDRVLEALRALRVKEREGDDYNRRR